MSPPRSRTLDVPLTETPYCHQRVLLLVSLAEYGPSVKTVFLIYFPSCVHMTGDTIDFEKKIPKAPDVLHKGDTVWEVLYIQPHNTFLRHSVCQANLALGFSARLTVVRASQLSVLQLVPVLVAR